jgi:hypothetical protein
MKILRLVGAMALALIASPCLAQTASSVKAPSGFAPLQAPCVKQTDGSCSAVSSAAPLPTTPGPLAAASSVPLAGTVTSTAVTPTSGAATIASGTATIGPFIPTLGRDIALKLWTTNSAAFSCQMFDSIDGGVTKLPLSIFDTPIGGPYSGPVNSVITSESVNGSTVYLVCTVASGTLNYWSGQ